MYPLFMLFDMISMFKLFFTLLFFLFLFNVVFFLYFRLNLNNPNLSEKIYFYFRYSLLFSITFLSIFFFCISFFFLSLWHGFELDLGSTDVSPLHQKKNSIRVVFFDSPLSTFIITKFSISIGLLFCVLFPIIILLMGSDYDNNFNKLFIYMFLVFKLSMLLIFTDNIILFYIAYEFILILVFASMYLSSNSRGGIEATMFFMGWAILGSILVGLSIMLLVILTNSYTFSQASLNKLTYDEVYYIYLLSFFGFGTKLSTWPFWYWLPRAHVEVSTSMSIFLSCVLIKLSYFCLIRVQLVLSTEISVNLCILVTMFCCVDVVFRLMSQKDLKAIIAYSSVLHTNLLLALIHMEVSKSLGTSILYVWGHSIATASLFICVNMIELRYGSRSIVNVSGLWSVNPSLACFTFWSLLTFIDFPCTMFFWGELWLWCVIFSNVPILAFELIILCVILFASIFFKIWWGVLFGYADERLVKPQEVDNFDYWIILIFLNLLQIFAGFQPSILSTIVNFIV